MAFSRGKVRAQARALRNASTGTSSRELRTVKVLPQRVRARRRSAYLLPHIREIPLHQRTTVTSATRVVFLLLALPRKLLKTRHLSGLQKQLVDNDREDRKLCPSKCLGGHRNSVWTLVHSLTTLRCIADEGCASWGLLHLSIPAQFLRLAGLRIPDPCFHVASC